MPPLCRRGIIVIALVAGIACSLTAQTSPRGKPTPGGIRETTVEIVLLTSDGGGLQAQQWRSALEPLEIPFSVRRGAGDDKPETSEKVIGTLRKVTATGTLDRTGKLTFADRSFQPGDRQKIKQWVSDLKTFGAQGTPEGKPLWGLSEDQFAKIYESVTKVSDADLRDEDLTTAISQLPLPADTVIRWSDAARKRVSQLREPPVVRQSTQGFSAATALAVMLKDHGLGFRPQRAPDGSLELVIDLPTEAAHVWPVGWPLKLPRQQAAPGLFKLQQVFFEDVPLLEVLSKTSEAAKVPVLFDYAELDSQPDWSDRDVSYPLRQATWHTVIRDVLNRSKLTIDLWQDEAGRPFLYVTTIKGRRGVEK